MKTKRPRTDHPGKRYRFLLVGCFVGLFALSTAYAANALPVTVEEKIDLLAEFAQENAPSQTQQRFEGVPVVISANGDGQYTLMSDVEIQLGQFGVENIQVEEPVLLSYAVSSAHQGGVWVLGLEQGQQMQERLERVRDSLSAQCGGAQAAQELDAVLAQLEAAGPYTQSST